ncbi:MAG TPA: cupin domain-containing protein [Solirubrobacteraceae bacterium]|jgi:mannose-6-phosphate isomerase-like protein (cupin superfamily)|nr:cupin domain-containing protein [Solirubrobacteraceae bacterium]
MSSDTDRGYVIVKPDDVADSYADSDVPGEFRRLTDALDGDQLAITLIRVPAHSDFEQGSGHHHKQTEEVYLVTRGTLTMRFSDAIETVRAPAAVRVAPGTTRSHRNEGDEDVEMWAISRQGDGSDATKVDEFWEASPEARQTRD